MTTTHIIFSIVIALLAIIYIVLSIATGRKAIVNIDGVVYAFKKRPNLIPTLVGIGIILLILASLWFTCIDCLSYSR